MQKFEKHIELNSAQQQATLIDCLSQNLELSRQKLKLALTNGCVWLESQYGIERCRRAKKMLLKTSYVHIYYAEEIQKQQPAVAKLIADEGAYSIWNKPSGMFTQGSKWGDHCTIYRWAEQHLQPQRPAFIVHRLDRAASGLIILAHKKTVAAKFSKMFEQHDLYKKYTAVVEGEMKGFKLPFIIYQAIDGKSAESQIIKLEFDQQCNKTQLEVVIKSGRKHQIRRHLAGLGWPIMGDRLYGESNAQLDLQLYSSVLKFSCPLTGELRSYRL